MLPEERLDSCGVEPPQSGRHIRVVVGALEPEASDDACQHGSMQMQLGLQKQIVLSWPACCCSSGCRSRSFFLSTMSIFDFPNEFEFTVRLPMLGDGTE
jgi:hypothetical protein